MVCNVMTLVEEMNKNTNDLEKQILNDEYIDLLYSSNTGEDKIVHPELVIGVENIEGVIQ